MEVDKLFKGIAVVIDDQIDNPDANINNLIKQIKQKNIPFLKSKTLPTLKITSNFHDLSFVLLDWDLKTNSGNSVRTEEGVKFPDTLSKFEIERNIKFIKELKNICYCPVFIFSNFTIDTIIDKLVDNNIYSKDQPNNNHIFVKSKSDLVGKTKLFEEIEKWVNHNPSIYVLKEWEYEYRKSKNKMFVELQELSPVWPKIMWQTYKKDGANKSLELGGLITRNLHTRMTPFAFSDEILGVRGKRMENDELNDVLEGERYLLKKNLDKDDIAPGDVFEISSEYCYINIRGSCDLIPNRNKNNAKPDDVQLYLLKGFVSAKKPRDLRFSKKHGLFLERDNQVIIFPILNRKYLDIHFKDLIIDEWVKLKKKRIGRILPPYITRIQQKYTQYLQRQGLPRIPSEAVYSSLKKSKAKARTITP